MEGVTPYHREGTQRHFYFFLKFKENLRFTFHCLQWILKRVPIEQQKLKIDLSRYRREMTDMLCRYSAGIRTYDCAPVPVPAPARHYNVLPVRHTSADSVQHQHRLRTLR